MLDTAPRFDDATEYSFAWNVELIEDLRPKHEIELLLEKDAVKERFASAVPNHEIVIFYDHGNETSLIEQGGQRAILDLNNVELVKGKQVYTMACLSAKELGVKAWQKGCLEYWGSKEVIGFTPDEHKLFQECYNLGAILRFAEMKPIQECLELVKNRFTENMNKTVNPWTQTWLRYDRDNWVCWSDQTPPPSDSTDCWARKIAVKIAGVKGWKFLPDFLKNERLKRFGYILFGSGVALLGEHIITRGVSWDIVLSCHGLIGFAAIFVSLVILAKEKTEKMPNKNQDREHPLRSNTPARSDAQ